MVPLSFIDCNILCIYVCRIWLESHFCEPVSPQDPRNQPLITDISSDDPLNLHNAKRSVILIQHPIPIQTFCSTHRVSTTVDTLSSSFFHVRSPIVQYDLQQHWNVSREQPNPTTQSIATKQWIRLILTYARHRRFFILRLEDAEMAESDWAEILRNERINRELSLLFLTPQLSHPILWVQER